MSAGNVKDKRLAFGRLLHDLHQDSLHVDAAEEREYLPKIAQSAAIAELRGRLSKRVRRNRLSPTLMYLPRIALTAAILLSCAVAFVYLRRLNEIAEMEKLQKKEQLNQTDSIRNDEKRY